MTSGTVSSLFVLLLSCTPALAQTQSAQFNQVLNINGDMALNSFQFPDRSKIETFSQKQQQLIVNQQTPAVPANQVTGSTGQPFVAMMAQSMSISTNGATQLVGGQIELAIDPQMLATNAVNPDNTWVAMLSPDRQTWMIQETMRSINASDMTVRMIKRTNLDGEYMALGRQTVETNALLTPFGSDPASAVAIQGTGLQENEFQDGFRMSTRATQPMTMNVDVKEGIDTGMLAALSGQEPVNDFRYSVVTNLAAVQPNLNRQVTVVQMPLNPQRLQQMMQSAGVGAGGQVALSVAKRDVLQNPGGATGNLNQAGAAPLQRRSRLFARQVQAAQPAAQPQGAASVPQAGTPTNNNPVAAQLLLAPTFTPVQANLILDTINMRVAFPVSAVDGEYIITMQTGAPGQQQPQAQQPQAQQPQAQQPPAQEPAAPQPGQQPATPEGQLQPSNGTTPAAGEPAAAPKPSGKTTPAAPAGEAPKAEGNGTAAAPAAGETPKKAERRQEAAPKLGDKPPQGSVYITMKEVDQMAQLWQWGGQAPISQMMDEFLGNATKA